MLSAGPMAIDWRVLILPCAFIAFCVLYYGGIWLYRMRVRGGRMAAVGKVLGGRHMRGHDGATSKAIPQFQGSQLRLARAAYNTVQLEWPLHGEARRVWMGDAGNQWNGDALLKAVGGEIVAGFIAVEVPMVRDAVIRDNERRADEQLSRAVGRGGMTVNLWEMLQEHGERSGLLRVRTGDSALDKAFDFWMESPAAFSAMINRKTEPMLRDHPGHIWVKNGVLLLEAGDRVWSREDFVSRAEWLRDFVERWEVGGMGCIEVAAEEKHRLL